MASVSTPVEAFNNVVTPPSTAVEGVASALPAVTASSSSASAPSSSIVVHHLNNSRSQRILWLLEELQVPYSIKRYERVNGLAPAELVAVHPLGKSPVITDSGHTIAESGAIVDYLIQRYGGERFSASDEQERLSLSYWSHAAEGSFMPPLVMLQIFKTVREKTPWAVRFVASGITNAVEGSYINPTVEKQLALVERTLKEQRAKGSDFFVGRHLTAADFMMLFPMEGIAAGGRGTLSLEGEGKQWVQRVHARDAYKRALQKGGEYAYAKM